jgi:hypothetical protein
MISALAGKEYLVLDPKRALRWDQASFRVYFDVKISVRFMWWGELSLWGGGKSDKRLSLALNRIYDGFGDSLWGFWGPRMMSGSRWF